MSKEKVDPKLQKLLNWQLPPLTFCHHHSVGRPSCLEGTSLLEIFTFEKKFYLDAVILATRIFACQLIEGWTCQHWSLMYKRLDSLIGLNNVAKRDVGWSHFNFYLSKPVWKNSYMSFCDCYLLGPNWRVRRNWYCPINLGTKIHKYFYSSWQSLRSIFVDFY